MRNTDALTIVAYHYVRDLEHTPFPRIKGLKTRHFEGQLDYLCKHYSIVGVDDVAALYLDGATLPSSPCLLTFDDGFTDHYDTVFPLLADRGLTAAFFPTAVSVMERRLIDVHKIQFVLAAAPDPEDLASLALRLLRPFRDEYDLPSDEDLYERYAVAGRFDPPKIVFVKRLLQRGLERSIRTAICDQLFERFVTDDQTGFANDLYASLGQLRAMVESGMHIGGHGYSHEWLGGLSHEDQREEIEKTVSMLASVYGRRPNRWTMCYPHGDWNHCTRESLKQHGCALGFTIELGLAEPDCDPLGLPRINTNDIPRSGGAPLSPWTLRVTHSGQQGTG